MSKRVALPQAIKAIREAKSLSDPAYRISQFATVIGMSPAHLCNIEANRKNATDEVIDRIATALGVTPDAISYESTGVAA